MKPQQSAPLPETLRGIPVVGLPLFIPPRTRDAEQPDPVKK
jgi:hypothetical protein